MELLQNLLSKLSVIEFKYRTKDEEKEQFNIFTVLHKERDEVKLHSRFLSVLLSPHSSHKKNDIFLKLFLDTLLINDFDTSAVDVYPTEINKSEYKNIDILIINRFSKQAIIIENKIGAPDCNDEESGQLERYYNVVLELGIPEKNIKVLYLSLDRHEPSRASVGKYETLEGVNGQTIDYEHEILDWLNLCLKECSNQPFIRETINQYINLIKRMTNNSDLNERLEIRELIASSSDNMKSTKLLIDNFDHVKWHTIFDFWRELEEKLKLLGCTIEQNPSEANITDTVHGKNTARCNDYGLEFTVDSNINLFIWNIDNEYENKWLCWGIDNKFPNLIAKSQRYSDENSYRSMWCSEKEGMQMSFDLGPLERIALSNFSEQGTFNLIRSSYRANILSKLVSEIKIFATEISRIAN